MFNEDYPIDWEVRALLGLVLYEYKLTVWVCEWAYKWWYLEWDDKNNLRDQSWRRRLQPVDVWDLSEYCIKLGVVGPAG